MRPSLKALLAIVTIVSNLTQSAYAHPDHAEAPGESAVDAGSAPIVITQQARANLGLLVEESEIRPLDHTIAVIGQIESIPAKSSAITSRISGRVSALLALDGESVKKGAALVDVESRQVGDPPPHVKYTSPFDGIIIDRHVNQGDTVEPDNHLMEVADLSEVYAEGRVYEGQVSSIKINQDVRVTVESFPAETFSGKIELISGALDAQTRTLSIWVRIKNSELKLRPNMRATLDIITAQSESVIAIPKSALLGEQGNHFVFVQNDQDPLSFERRPVVTGIKDDKFIEITEGVLPKDKVVTVGNYQLQYVTAKSAASHSEHGAENISGSAKFSGCDSSGLFAKFGLIILGALMCFIGTYAARRIASKGRAK